MGRYRTIETEQQKRSYAARIWWVFWGVAFIALVYTVWHQVREYDLVHNGQCIEAEYYIYNGNEYARFIDENNRYRILGLGGFDAVHGEDTVNLYYKTRPSLAEPHRDPRAWLFAYVLFGPLFVWCSIKLYKIYHTKPDQIYTSTEE